MHVSNYRQAAPVVCSMEALMPVSEFKIAGPALLLLNREGKSASSVCISSTCWLGSAAVDMAHEYEAHEQDKTGTEQHQYHLVYVSLSATMVIGFRALGGVWGVG